MLEKIQGIFSQDPRKRLGGFWNFQDAWQDHKGWKKSLLPKFFGNFGEFYAAW